MYKMLDKIIKKPCYSCAVNWTPTPRVKTKIKTSKISCCSVYHSKYYYSCSSSPISSPTSHSYSVYSSFDNSAELDIIICQISAEADKEYEGRDKLRHFMNIL